MKKLILLFLLIPTITFSQIIEVIDDNEVIGQLHRKHLEKLIEASEQYKEIIEAQSEERIEYNVVDRLYKIDENKYRTDIEMFWYDEKGNIVNFLVIEMTLNIDDNTKREIGLAEKIYKQYSNFTDIGFPLLLILFILL